MFRVCNPGRLLETFILDWGRVFGVERAARFALGRLLELRVLSALVWRVDEEEVRREEAWERVVGIGDLELQYPES